MKQNFPSSIPGASSTGRGNLSTQMSSLTALLVAGGILRVFMILYGEWQDRHFEVPYTDVDYLVFTDAARSVWEGGSPFDRYTYRYTPLLSYLLLPNLFLVHSWGKLVFSVAELLVASQIHALLSLRGTLPDQATLYAATWLFNPFTFTVATRGNCEALVSAMLLRVLRCLFKGRLVEGGFWYGLAVHFRIYPIIYALPILLFLNNHHPSYSPSQPNTPQPLNHPISQPHDSEKARGPRRGDNLLRGWVGGLERSKGFFLSLGTRERVIFGIMSGTTFMTLTLFFFWLYGWRCLNESLLYHLTRADPRHNFSIYFYQIYLSTGTVSIYERLFSFLPQLAVQLSIATSLALDLPFCFLVQTMAFVTFNKVVTAQYFVWYFSLLPLTIPYLTLQFRTSLVLVFVWVGSQFHWLGWAYWLEFEGWNVLLQLWGASLLFFVVNVIVLVILVRYHSFTPVFIRGQINVISKCTKQH